MRRILLSALALFGLAAGIACGGDDAADPTPAATIAAAQTTAASPPPTQAKELKTVTVGYIPILINAPIYVAIAKGYFAEEGLNIKLERLAGGADMLVQTAAGNFDIGGGGIGAAVFNAAGAAIKEKKEVPFEVFAPLHSEKPPVTTPLVVSKARYDSGEITKVSDLKGKKVSINARGASTEYWLDRALASGGLAYKDVTVQAVGFQDVAAALQNKSIDGAMLGEPLATQAKDAGLVTIVKDDFVNGDQPTGLYWNRAWAKKNPELAAGFLKAYLRAVKELDPDSAWKDPAILATIEKYTTVPADTIKRASRPYNDVNGKLNLESFKKQEQFFRGLGLLTYEGDLDYSLFMKVK